MSETNPFLDVHEIPAGPLLVEVINLCYEANRPLLFIGGTGVAKSSLLRQYAASRKVWYAARDLSLMEPPDLVGLPQFEDGRTHFRPPAFLPGPGTEGLLVFEELNRAPRYMRSPCLELLTARRLNDYVVPDGVRFAATINPAADGFDVDELDAATLARFVRVRVRPDRDGWLNWAAKEQLDHRVIGYVGTDDSVFDAEVSNPRAWEMVSRLLTARPAVDVKSKAFQAAVAGCVGGKRAAAFCKFLTRGVHPLTADAILGADGAGPTVRGWAREGRLDLVEQSLLNVMKKVQSRKGYETVRHDGGAWAALGKFRAALPAEHREKMDEQFAEYGYELPGSNRPKGTKGGKS